MRGSAKMVHLEGRGVKGTPTYTLGQFLPALDRFLRPSSHRLQGAGRGQVRGKIPRAAQGHAQVGPGDSRPVRGITGALISKRGIYDEGLGSLQRRVAKEVARGASESTARAGSEKERICPSKVPTSQATRELVEKGRGEANNIPARKPVGGRAAGDPAEIL